MSQRKNKKIYYHLPGLFEFYELYCVFLPLYKEHREYFYDWCEISSIYGSPADCLEGTEKVDYTVYIWYNVSIKYRRCFYDRTTAEIDAKSIHGNI